MNHKLHRFANLLQWTGSLLLLFSALRADGGLLFWLALSPPHLWHPGFRPGAFPPRAYPLPQSGLTKKNAPDRCPGRLLFNLHPIAASWV